MTKLVEPRYCPRCEGKVETHSLIREQWCPNCKAWRVGIRLTKEDHSVLSYDDMGCYLERE